MDEAYLHFGKSRRAHLTSVASFWNLDYMFEPENRVEPALNGANAKRWFADLAAAKAEIEKEVGGPLLWYEPDDAKICTMATKAPAELRDEKLWPDQFEWLRRNLELFAKVFGPPVKTLWACSHCGGCGEMPLRLAATVPSD